MVTKLPTLLPKGNIFGSETDDEFTIKVNGETRGIFKQFEYLSLPFSITGQQQKYQQLIERAKRDGTSFAQELSQDSEAQAIVSTFFEEMRMKPMLSRQILDVSIPRMFVTDNVMTGVTVEEDLESLAAKVIVTWQKLADFYCMEGLLGGGGKNNPFVHGRSSSLLAGSLDSLEAILPVLKQRTEPEEWKKVCLQLSMVVGRDYRQIDQAVDVLTKVFGVDSNLTVTELYDAQKTIKGLSRLRLETNVDVGKLYNTLVRFHNWLPLALTANGPKGEAYDSICIPARVASTTKIDQQSLLATELKKITDATSPKGLAIAMLIDEGELGDRQLLLREVSRLEGIVLKEAKIREKEFRTLTLEDPAFYTGLVGGKWRGLKLLHDTRQALDLKYKIPPGFVITSVGTTRLLQEQGIVEILNSNIYTLDETRREEIVERIARIQIEKSSLPEMEALSDSLMIRSSMYGEDGGSNFSGTYASVATDKRSVAEAIREVMASYFSQEAVRSREDLRLAHLPGIGVIVQEKIYGRGGVLHVVDGKCTLSFEESPQHAVDGNRTTQTSGDISEVVVNTPLQKIASDLYTLHDLFGDYDVEFVVDQRNEEVYLTQLRPKLKVISTSEADLLSEHITIRELEQLDRISLTANSVVRMEFLGRENMMDKAHLIMNFIRRN